MYSWYVKNHVVYQKRTNYLSTNKWSLNSLQIQQSVVKYKYVFL